jgi:cyclopropane fatty-acyl-phospholipid synthase-like methyltransferase
MLVGLPFLEGAFDGVWFIEAFEYVPPDMRRDFLGALRTVVRQDGTVFMNAANLSETNFLSYIGNYLYWRILKRAPVSWGEYIYKLDLPLFKGWHYHSLVLNGRRMARQLREAGFEILESKRRDKDGYSTYLLRTI